MCLRAANTSLEPRASNNYMSLTSRCEVQHRLEVRARRSREHFKGHPSIAYAGTLSHVVLTASTKLSLNIYSLNKNTVPELVHPKLYLNTVCITSCSLVAPDPYLRRHTMYTAPIYGSPKVYHRIKLKRVSPSISATPIPRISTLRPYLSSLYNPNAPSDRSLLQYLPFPPSLLMLAPSQSIWLRRSNLKLSQFGAKGLSMSPTVTDGPDLLARPVITRGMARPERRLHHAC
jgi:hypothetical protein